MKWYYNLKVGAKIVSGFLIVTLIAGVIGAVGFTSISDVGNIKLPSVIHLQEIKNEFSKIGSYQNKLMNPKLSFEEREEVYRQVDEAKANLDFHRNEYITLPMGSEEKELWTSLEIEYAKWEESNNNFFALSKQLDDMGIDDPKEIRYQITLRKRDHINWIWTLLGSIDSLQSFDGQLDGTKCALGHWLEEYKPRSVKMSTLLEEIKGPHLKVHESGAKINDLISNGGSLSEAKNIYYNESLPNMNTVLNILDEMDALVEASDLIFTQMIEVVNNEVNPQYALASAVLEKLVDLNGENAHDKVSRANILMVIFILAGITISILLGIFISTIIRKPINKLVNASQKIADGNLDIIIDIHTKDEVGLLANAFKKMTENINEVMSHINQASNQVAAGSRQVSESSMSLSQGATEQASSIEELTTSIEEIAEQTRENAKNSSVANEISESAKMNASHGHKQMTQMLYAMDQINESSSSISKIIKVIDEIAFQTNILALNAAVEAAQAGKHGKGFAVVAEEVRNLAARSASAAKETTAMIENSIKKVDDGTKIANQTAEALNNIVEAVDKVSALVNEIAISSKEQSLGVDQINQGLIQIAHVVQSTSATSEETAAASEELSSQAEMLRNQVARFKLKNSFYS